MNYRHAFHAGNFADLLKHAGLMALLDSLLADPRPLTVIDTHAGAGAYDLGGIEARKTGEAGAAIDRLMASADAPEIFAPLRAMVESLSAGRSSGVYPGSPLIIARSLRPNDKLIACELRPDDHAILAGALPRQHGVEALQADGWRTARNRAPAAPHRLLVLIDPPFERPDDGELAAALAADLLKRNPTVTVAIWVPIKDLARHDAFATALSDRVGRAPVLIAEVRLRPLDDPMRLNGCALVVINPPDCLAGKMQRAGAWIAETLGEAGGKGEAWNL